MFEALTLIQTGKIQHFPIVMVGTEFYAGLLDWFRGRLVADGMIAPDDVDLIAVTDDPAEVVDIMKRAARRRAEASAN